MIKVVIIFAIIVCVIMVLGCDKKSKKGLTVQESSTNGELDIHSYSNKHARSIQDDIKKAVNKNI